MPHMRTNPNPGALRAEHEAFAQIMRNHNQRLFRTARAILRDDAEAEDALQDAYLQAYRALPEFRGDAALSTWLVRIVVNEALGRLRRRGA
jgi:RNA polymerase sigma-70 factor (ECF subfamily)